MSMASGMITAAPCTLSYVPNRKIWIIPKPMTKQRLDVIFVGDFREPLCATSTVLEQITAAAAAGYRTGVLQLKSVSIDYPAPLHHVLRALITGNEITLLDPDLPSAADILIATDPTLFTFLPKRRLQLDAGLRLIMVREAPLNTDDDEIYDWITINRHAAEVLGGAVTFAPLNHTIRHALINLDPAPSWTEDDWRDVVDAKRWVRAREDHAGSRPVIGRHGPASLDAWPGDPQTLLAAYPDNRQLQVRLLGGDVLKRLIRPFPLNWEVLQADRIETEHFLSTLDFFVHTQPAGRDPLLAPSILEAMASGLVVILPPSFEPIFGEAAVYARPDEIEATVWRLHGDRAAYLRQSKRAVQAILDGYSPEAFTDRLDRLIGPPKQAPSSASDSVVGALPSPAQSPKRVLFITINGVGMGHLTRMLAIARRCPAPIEPVFLTMSQALKVVREQGFLAEYVPSRKYLDCDLARWNGYLCDEVSEMIAFYDPTAVLFDGNVPYQGVIDAMKANPEPWYVWSRRGMWRAGNPELLSRETFFDAVLEPGDLAEDDDHGMTTRYRSRTRRVKPIRLLDTEEMLSREEARRELGLSLDKHAVLIQLGAGNNFDYQTIHKTAYAHVTERHGAEVAVGEWLISEKPIDLPDGAVRLPGYPFAKYFNAFDLAISAVGYNSFHELLYAGIPTILVPNEAMEQDNQLARALYADRHGLASCVRAKEIYSFTERIDELFDDTRREAMTQKLASLDPGNGARETAEFIEEMVYSRRVDRA